MIRRLNFLWLTILLLAVAGCGETKTVTTTATSTTTAAAATTTTTTATVTTALRVTTAVSCQPGVSFAGCSVTAEAAPLTPGRLSLAPISGPEFPDVSSWQGHPDWGAVFAWQRSHGWATGGFFKLGEYHVDTSAAYNANALRGAAFRAGYWFVRATGCQHEADLIVATARQLGVHFVWLDVEVGEARGYPPCLLPKVRGAGLGVGVYTGPGTWTGDNIPSSTPLWDAAYNFHGPSTVGLWTSHTDCWQFTDGTFASRTNVPGIGYDDVNVDFSCAKLVGGTPRPPNPLAVLDHTVRHFPGGVTAREYDTVRTWRVHGCRRPIQRRVCLTSHNHARLLRGRLQSVLAFGHHGHGFDHVFKRLALLGSVSE